jgi:proton glutamate symport protein
VRSLLALLDHRRHPAALTVAAITALVMGLALGMAAHESTNVVLHRAVAVLTPVGTLWTNALRMIVLPLIVAHIVVALGSPSLSRHVGRLTALAFALFLALLALAAAYTLLLAPPLVHRLAVSPDAIQSLRANVAMPAGTSSQHAGTLQFTDWLTGLVPANLLGAAARGDMLPVIIATVLFSVALRSITPARREALLDVMRAIAEVTMAIAGWLIRLLPIAVLALTAEMASHSGLVIARGIGYFILLLSALLAGFTVVLYPIASLGGRISLRRFARGVAPSQGVALGTRSSLASLPVLLDGARTRLGLAPAAADFVLPLSVSVFKLNRTISSPLKLLILAHLFGFTVTPESMVVFIAAVTVLSFGSPGIPSGGSLVTLPFYLAAGAPVEGVILLTAVDAIPDMFKTVLNVTADMSVAAIVSRLLPRIAPADTAAGVSAPEAGVLATADAARTRA